MVQSLYTRACCRPTFSSFRPIQENRKTQKTDVESKQEIIKQSIASYRGSYPCPYIPIARKGAVADAAQTAGGAAPLWYEKDVMQKMVDEVLEEDVAVGTSDLPSFTSPTSPYYVNLTRTHFRKTGLGCVEMDDSARRQIGQTARLYEWMCLK
jgi:hypothetical protein